jgi:hypothetical protein
MQLTKKIGNRGIALGVVLLMAIVFTIAAVGLLALALSAGKRNRVVFGDRLEARYAAEAGIVFAMQQLWFNQNYPDANCGPGLPNRGKTMTDASLNIDVDGDGTAETPVMITVTNCGIGLPHQISARVNFVID